MQNRSNTPEIWVSGSDFVGERSNIITPSLLNQITYGILPDSLNFQATLEKYHNLASLFP